MRQELRLELYILGDEAELKEGEGTRGRGDEQDGEGEEKEEGEE